MTTPLHKHEDPQWKISDDGSTQARIHGGALGGSYPQIFFVPPNFVMPRNICFKHMIK